MVHTFNVVDYNAVWPMSPQTSHAQLGFLERGIGVSKGVEAPFNGTRRLNVTPCDSVKQAFFKQLQTQSHPFAVVQRKDTHRSPPNRRETFD